MLRYDFNVKLSFMLYFLVLFSLKRVCKNMILRIAVNNVTFVTLRGVYSVSRVTKPIKTPQFSSIFESLPKAPQISKNKFFNNILL